MAGLLDGLRLAGQRYRPELGDADVMSRTPWRGEITQRSEVLPFGIYQQPDGSKRASWAMPGLLSGDDNALMTPRAAYGEDTSAYDQNIGRVGIGNALGLGSARPFYRVPQNALGAAGSGAKPQGITAYHGSPHDFDRFDMSKIGTGEGAGAYGHGLYFADNKSVAERYRDILSKRYDMTNVSEETAKNLAAQILSEFDGDAKEAAASLVKKAARYPTFERARQIISGDVAPPTGKGRLYEIRINADPNDFLDWDKPLSQQSEKVKGAFASAGRADLLDTAEPYQARDALEKLGSARLRPEQPSREMMNEATAALREAGIPGIRYLDQGSRAAGEGSRNYVVFDDKLVDILRKYGLFGGIGAGAYAASSDGQSGLMP